ncbi:hypothetical protein XU18_1591 [Perkinsela sp. CCAP 1560/4]|nr:hypothetical protein XU18_1591 [Perkinsela sp. CCAP 1560/4]|eukprot:KNH07781.1 hypothetical protein XU18_1591 [Perkinsela sp. CCAP 1560/4]
MTLKKEAESERVDEEHRLIRKWREVVAETEKLDKELINIENERETAMLEKQVLEQKLRGLKEAHSGEEDSRIISNMQTEIEKYSQLATHEENHASDLELWCSRRSAKNQTHLDTLQHRSQEIRQVELESAQMDILPLETIQYERQITQIKEDLGKLLNIVHCHEDSLELCFGLAKENEVLLSTHVKIAQLESLSKEATIDISKLSHASKGWETILAHRRSLLGEIEKELCTTMDKAFSTIRNVRAELNSIDPCEFSHLDILHSMVSEGKLYTDSDATLQAVGQSDFPEIGI